MADKDNGAQFSDDRRHRLALWRSWSREAGFVMFIGFNPSTADETRDDQTIRKCVGFAKRWGYGGIHMLNLFTLVSTDPRTLYLMDNCHDECNRFLRMYAKASEKIVCAWGRFEISEYRVKQISGLLPEEKLFCLGVNGDGSPKHPLYIPYSKTLERFEI